jgi:hypothetical protein
MKSRKPLLGDVNTVEIIIVRPKDAPSIVFGCIAGNPSATELWDLASGGFNALEKTPDSLRFTCDVTAPFAVYGPDIWVFTVPALRDRRLGYELRTLAVCRDCARRYGDRCLIDHLKNSLLGDMREISASSGALA